MSTQVSKHAQLKMNKASKLEALQASLKSVARMKLDIEHLKALQEVYEHQVTLHQSAATKTPVKSAAKSVASDEAKPKRQKTKREPNCQQRRIRPTRIEDEEVKVAEAKAVKNGFHESGDNEYREYIKRQRRIRANRYYQRNKDRLKEKRDQKKKIYSQMRRCSEEHDKRKTEINKEELSCGPQNQQLAIIEQELEDVSNDSSDVYVNDIQYLDYLDNTAVSSPIVSSPCSPLTLDAPPK